MARRWLVKDDDGIIGGFTDDDDVGAPTGYTATTIADDATGVPADGPRSGGTWTATTSTYTLAPSQTNETDPDVAAAVQKMRLHEAYKYFQVNGRTEHWRHLRTGPCNRCPALDRYGHLGVPDSSHWLQHHGGLMAGTLRPWMQRISCSR